MTTYFVESDLKIGNKSFEVSKNKVKNKKKQLIHFGHALIPSSSFYMVGIR